ncbi:MAG: hypothetical protein EA388_01775 [Nitriliruptor sp.]|nr:MAG: hypothetical protein EA388_01775 [Nitriliruptor sp.]
MGDHHDPHARYDGLALDHVLGGLSGRAAAEFRSHLSTCGDCRSRVDELRGIADELGEIERDERSRARLQTEVVRRDESEHAPAEPTRRLTVGHVTVATILVLLLAAGVAFWNLHLRTTIGAYESVVSSQSEALRDLAAGVLVDAEFAEGVSGRLVATDEQLAFTLAGLDVVADDVAAVWVTDGDGEVELVAAAPAELLDSGTYAGVLDLDGVVEVIITLEVGQPGTSPEGPEQASSDLDAVVD